MDPTAPKDPLSQASSSANASTPKDPVQPGQFVVAGEDDGIFKQPPPMNPATNPPKASSPSFISSPNQTVTDSSLNNATSAPNLASKAKSSPLGWSSPSPAGQSSSLSGSLASLSAKPPPVQSPLPPLGEASVWPNTPPPSAPQTPLQPVAAVGIPSPISPPGPEVSPSLPQISQSQTPPQIGSQQPSPEPFVPPTIENAPQEEPSKIKNLRKIAIIIGALILIAAIALAAWFFVISKMLKKEEPAKTETVEQVEEPPALPKKKSGGFSELPPIPAESTREATSGSQTN